MTQKCFVSETTKRFVLYFFYLHKIVINSKNFLITRETSETDRQRKQCQLYVNYSIHGVRVNSVST